MNQQRGGPKEGFSPVDLRGVGYAGGGRGHRVSSGQPFNSPLTGTRPFTEGGP